MRHGAERAREGGGKGMKGIEKKGGRGKRDMEEENWRRDEG